MNSQTKNKPSQCGLSLIEILVATAIVVGVSVMAGRLFTMSSRSLKQSADQLNSPEVGWDLLKARRVETERLLLNNWLKEGFSCPQTIAALGGPCLGGSQLALERHNGTEMVAAGMPLTRWGLYEMRAICAPGAVGFDVSVKKPAGPWEPLVSLPCR